MVLTVFTVYVYINRIKGHLIPNIKKTIKKTLFLDTVVTFSKEDFCQNCTLALEINYNIISDSIIKSPEIQLNCLLLFHSFLPLLTPRDSSLSKYSKHHSIVHWIAYTEKVKETSSKMSAETKQEDWLSPNYL